MTCRLCGIPGESSNNPLLTLECSHSFHQNCIQPGICPICTENQQCAICLEPVDPSVEPLEGCIHKFHPSCIIPYFRSCNGECPLCRRNPHAKRVEDSDSEDDSEDDISEHMGNDFVDDEAWTALKKIRALQLRQAAQSESKSVKRRVKSINSRIEKARAARAKADEINRLKREENRVVIQELTTELKKRREERSKKKKKFIQAGRVKREIEKQIRQVRRKNRPSISREPHPLRLRYPFPGQFIDRRSNFKMTSDKSRIGSQANPEYQYFYSFPGVWSEKLSSEDLQRLYAEGHIHDETLIRHPKLTQDVVYRVLKKHIDLHFI